MPAISAVQGIVDGLKTVEIRVNHVNLVYAAKWVSLAYTQTSQSHEGNASHLGTVSQIPLTILLPPGEDCVAVKVREDITGIVLL